MRKFIAILMILFDLPDKTVLFDHPVIVKKDSVSILECWGAALAGDGVWLVDDKGDWHEILPEDNNADLVIEAVHERLLALKLKAA